MKHAFSEGTKTIEEGEAHSDEGHKAPSQNANHDNHNRAPKAQAPQAARSSHGSHSHGSHSHAQMKHPSSNVSPLLTPTPPPTGRPIYRKKGSSFATLVKTVIVLAVICAVLFAMFFPWDKKVTINGQETTVSPFASFEQIASETITNPKAGNLLALDGSLLAEGGGDTYKVVVNGQALDNLQGTAKDNDVIEITTGVDKTEDVIEEYIDVMPPITFNGTGALHVYNNDGVIGSTLRKTGSVSGQVVEEVLVEPSPATLSNVNLETGDDNKVVALTFDDGPWPEYTDQILDTLAKYDAKATFFTVGERIEKQEDSVKRAFEEGHQISTHSWDHASGSGQGVNLGYMTEQEQYDEIAKGLEEISRVTGADASSVIRVPGGNFSEDTARILSALASSEIGWNIDTSDWRRPGAEVIAQRILMATPGSVILMHDGGGDRSQTVEALNIALPQLVEQGYRFVTINELLGYLPNDSEINVDVAN